MMPLVTSPVFTAASIEPARRMALMARMCSAWPPSTPSPVLDMPSVMPEIAVGVQHEHAGHARQPRSAPRAAALHVGRKIAGRKKAVGKDPVGGCGLEAGLRRR